MLSSLNSPRSRRKLKRDEVDLREQLAEVLACAVEALRGQNVELVEREVEMRKAREQVWMRERLEQMHEPQAVSES